MGQVAVALLKGASLPVARSPWRRPAAPVSGEGSAAGFAQQDLAQPGAAGAAAGSSWGEEPAVFALMQHSKD